MASAAPVEPPHSRKARLEATVSRFGADIGPRNIYHSRALERAADDIEAAFQQMGYRPSRQTYIARGHRFSNIVAELPAASAGVFLVGAHYDTHKDSPGANDNGSALASLLELARGAAAREHRQTLRLVAFTNEETPFTRTGEMGSWVYARECRAKGENIAGMLCLEMLGSYSDELGSQRLSLRGLLLPRRGNFIALVGNRRSRELLRAAAAALSRPGPVRVEAWTLPTDFPAAWSSDHWSFWKHGYPALMATDTGPLRYRHYHTREDTPDKVDFAWLERVTNMLDALLAELAGGGRRMEPCRASMMCVARSGGCPNHCACVDSVPAEGGNRPLVVGTTSARPFGLKDPGRPLSSLGSQPVIWRRR
jgi:peptidase M28-like protein